MSAAYHGGNAFEMTKFKYTFRVYMQEPFMKEACELMRHLDLNIGEVAAMKIIEFEGNKDVPIDELKAHLTKAIESLGTTVLKIEGGKIE